MSALERGRVVAWPRNGGVQFGVVSGPRDEASVFVVPLGLRNVLVKPTVELVTLWSEAELCAAAQAYTSE